MEFKLYEIADQYQAAVNTLVNLDLPPEVIDDTLEALTGVFAEKACQVAAVILQMEGEAELIEQAMRRMGKRRKALAERAERLRGYLKTQMERTATEEVKSPEFVIRIKPDTPQLVIDDEELVPRKFKTKERLVQLDADKLKTALQAGKAVKGAHLEPRTRLDIG